MKNNLISCMILGTVILSSLAITSCSDDEHYDITGNPENFIYLDVHGPVVYQNQLITTPSGIFGMAGANIPVNIQRPAKASVEAMVVDSLVGRYNRENNTNYKAFPASALSSLQITSAQFYGTQTDTISVNMPEDKFSLFTDSAYVLPLKLTNAHGGKITETENYTIAYVVVTTASTENFISITGDKTVERKIAKTPVGTFGSVSATFGTTILTAVSSNCVNTLEVDNSLISTYNTEHGTSYKALPDTALNALEITSNTIVAGQTTTKENIKVSMPDETAYALDGSFIVPLKLKSTFGAKTYQEDDDVVYLIINSQESVINDSPTEFLGEIQTNHDAWKCLEADVFNPADLQKAFGSGWSARWPFTTLNVSSGTFILDLGAEHKISGFKYSGYVMTNFTLSVGSGNGDWKEIATAKGHNPIKDYSLYRYLGWYVFYGGVATRYVKIKVDCDPESWAWSRGYGKLTFNLAFDD